MLSNGGLYGRSAPFRGPVSARCVEREMELSMSVNRRRATERHSSAQSSVTVGEMVVGELGSSQPNNHNRRRRCLDSTGAWK